MTRLGARHAESVGRQEVARLPNREEWQPGNAVQSGTVRRSSPEYADRVMPIDRTNTEERLARIEQIIEEHCGAKQRQLLHTEAVTSQIPEEHTHASMSHGGMS